MLKLYVVFILCLLFCVPKTFGIGFNSIPIPIKSTSDASPIKADAKPDKSQDKTIKNQEELPPLTQTKQSKKQESAVKTSESKPDTKSELTPAPAQQNQKKQPEINNPVPPKPKQTETQELPKSNQNIAPTTQPKPPLETAKPKEQPINSNAQASTFDQTPPQNQIIQKVKNKTPEPTPSKPQVSETKEMPIEIERVNSIPTPDINTKANENGISSDEKTETVKVRRKKGEKDYLVISHFRFASYDDRDISDKFEKFLKSYFISSKFIQPYGESEIPNQIYIPEVIEDYDTFKHNNIDYLTTGTINYNSQSREVVIKIALWDIFYKAALFNKEYIGSIENIDTLSATIATDVYSYITGDFGYFYGNLLYTSRDYSATTPFRRITTTSLDGTETLYYTDGTEMAMNPKYCAASNEIIFSLQKKASNAELYIINRTKKTRQRLAIPMNEIDIGSFFSPDFSPTCQYVVFSMAKNGRTNIYLLNRELGRVSQLTSGNGIDTSSSFFDEGRKIVFTSNRMGFSKVFAMDLSGKNQTMLSSSLGMHLSPSVSPDGKSVAFVKIYDGKFSLMVMDINGGNERELKTAYLIENPTWAPAGNNIIFSMRETIKSKSKIYSMSVINESVDELYSNGEAGEPLWIVSR